MALTWGGRGMTSVQGIDVHHIIKRLQNDTQILGILSGQRNKGY